jgi:ribosomal protein S18 acetylase RimI-like enzyme
MASSSAAIVVEKHQTLDEPLLKQVKKLYGEIFGPEVVDIGYRPDDPTSWWLLAFAPAKNAPNLAHLASATPLTTTPVDGRELIGLVSALERGTTKLFGYNLGVGARWRGQGLAKRLAKELLLLADDKHQTVYFSVRKDRPDLLALYKQHGCSLIQTDDTKSEYHSLQPPPLSSKPDTPNPSPS